MNSERFASYLAPFAELPTLRRRLLDVLTVLPPDVQRDFLDDARFHVSLETFHPDKGWQLFMLSPGSSGSRCVVLRSRLDNCSDRFAHYVIAHEFAHAYLRNGPWGEITDVELAADALAAAWGFRRP
jgi:hypothetical protein